MFPNAFRAVHTQIAYKTLTAQYKHRLHDLTRQGLFTDKIAEQIERVVEVRARELEQFLHLDGLSSLVERVASIFCSKRAQTGDGRPSDRSQARGLNSCRDDHPVVHTFNCDMCTKTLPSVTTQPIPLNAESGIDKDRESTDSEGEGPPSSIELEQPATSGRHLVVNPMDEFDEPSPIYSDMRARGPGFSTDEI